MKIMKALFLIRGVSISCSLYSPTYTLWERTICHLRVQRLNDYWVVLDPWREAMRGVYSIIILILYI